jgi:hypothetical protein
MSDVATVLEASAISLAAAAAGILLLRRLCGPCAVTGKFQRVGEMKVFDGLMAFAVKRRERRERVSVALYLSIHSSPVEGD